MAGNWPVLLDLPGQNINGHTEELERLRHYPAVLATFTMGIAAVLARREEVLPRLLTQPMWTPIFSNGERQVRFPRCAGVAD